MQDCALAVSHLLDFCTEFSSKEEEEAELLTAPYASRAAARPMYPAQMMMPRQVRQGTHMIWSVARWCSSAFSSRS